MIKDRIVEIREVPASELRKNPRNFRTHPEPQRAAMEGILKDVGNVDVLKAVKTAEGLVLIDGHLRSDLLGDELVKVAVLDLTEEEAAKVLLTFDRLSSIAGVDNERLNELIRQSVINDAAIDQMLIDWKEELVPVLTEEEIMAPPAAQVTELDGWGGMPEFKSERWSDRVGQVIVSFATEEDMSAFSELVGQPIAVGTRRSTSIWYPKKEERDWATEQYDDETQLAEPEPDDETQLAEPEPEDEQEP